jgi:periplasmic copper chaperone A
MKSTFYARHVFAVTSLFVLASSINAACAHVVLDQKSAPAGSYLRTAFRVGHGCDGSATRALSVLISADIKNAKPAPKAGWTIERKMEKLAVPYVSHGKTVTERVAEITWRGGPLADEHFDEFVVQLQLPETAGPIWFKVLQQCEKGQIEWAEVPAQGLSTKGLKAPAALLEVIAPGTEKAVDAHKH